VRARQQKYLGSLLLADAPYGKPAVEDMLEGLLTGIQKNGLDKLPWAKGGDQLRQRLKFMQHRCPGWTDMSDEALLASCGEWLGPFLRGISSWQQLQKVDVVAALLTKLTAKERRELEEWAPTHIRVPGCRGVVVDYSDPEAPALAVRLQDLFGSNETPCIARGQVKLVLHILSPARRPVQVTQDLAGFWQTTYPSLRKGLMGRYPKHNWPEDPSKAKPNQPASR
jgi:ATP-dependent helicase HrpB